MVVDILYFAMLREKRGRASEQLEVPVGTQVGELFAQLFPVAGEMRVAYAVNQQTVGAEHALGDGDEVAFLPPVGGG